MQIRRRDATGHLDPRYAADLRALGGKKDRERAAAFLKGYMRSSDSLAERQGEEFVLSATSGQSEAERASAEEVVTEELGGPFVMTNGREEFARGADRSNPEGSTREPFPKS